MNLKLYLITGRRKKIPKKHAVTWDDPLKGFVKVEEIV